MADSDYPEVTGADIEAVGEKLKRLHDQLPPGQRLVMEWLLSRAAEASGDVHGHQLDVSPGLGAFSFGESLGLSAFKFDASSRFAYKYAPPQ